MVAPFCARVAQADEELVGLQDKGSRYWNSSLVCHNQAKDNSTRDVKLLS